MTGESLRRLVLSAGALGLAGAAILLWAWPAVAATAVASRKSDEKAARPNLALRASPQISFSPSRVYVVAELRGGADDYEPYYCPAIEWEWGDGTRSQSSYDCEPYEAGASEIRRRYSAEHTFHMAGDYRIQLRLKQKDKTVATARTNVKVRPGLRDPS